MTRSTFLATLCAVLCATSVASADLAPAPPPPLTVQGARSSITTSGSPGQATYTLTNESALPMEVFLDRVILEQGRMRVPLRVVGASDESGRELGQRFTVPANDSVRVTVRFEAPRGRASRWALTLRVMAAGRRIEGTAHVSRGHRDPARRKLTRGRAARG